MDVPGGRVSTGPAGGDGGWDEHPGGIPRVGSVPGHRAQDAGLLSAAGLPAEDSAPGVPTLRQAQEEPYTGVIDRILEDGLRRPGKQRHTAKRIFERLQGRVRFRWRIHHGQGLRPGESPPVAEDVRAVVPCAGPGPVRLRGSPGGHWRSVAEWSGRPTASSWTCVNPPGRLWVCPARRPGGGTSDAKGA